MPTRGNAWKSGVRARPALCRGPARAASWRTARAAAAGAPRSRFMSLMASLRRGHSHVHVKREGGLAASQLAHRVVDALVAGAGGHPHLLPDGEGVGAAGRRTQAERAQLAVERQAQVPELGGRAGHGPVDAGPQLERRLVGLRGHVRAQLGLERGQHAVDLVGERPALRLEEHDLLLDPKRVVGGGALGRPVRPPREGHAAREAGNCACRRAACHDAVEEPASPPGAR